MLGEITQNIEVTLPMLRTGVSLTIPQSIATTFFSQ